jgi:hypothetical protein
MNANELIALAFALTNALRLVSYAPQIWRVARDRGGAQAISCLTWNLWIAANATTALYAWTQLHDLLLAIVNAANATCCASVVLITLAKRSAHARAATAPTPHRLEIAMTSNPRPQPDPRCTPPCGAGALGVSIAAALIVGLLTLVQSTAIVAQSPSTIAVAGTPSGAADASLDAGVDWSCVEPMPDPAGASVAAYER